MNDFLKTTFIFAAGAAVGAAVAMLLAPRTGEELRGKLHDLAEDNIDKLKKACEKAGLEIECKCRPADAAEETTEA